MNWLLITLTIVSILLITLILLQKANTDGTTAASGDTNVGGNRKRGLEKTIFQTTILVAVVFALFNMIAVFVK
jgi:hypothetical protein